jgi:hypothetical protein
MNFLACLIVIAPKCAIELGFMMKTILTHNNELVMETLCLENHDNFKNILRFPREKMCPHGKDRDVERMSLVDEDGFEDGSTGRRWG